MLQHPFHAAIIRFPWHQRKEDQNRAQNISKDSANFAGVGDRRTA